MKQIKNMLLISVLALASISYASDNNAKIVGGQPTAPQGHDPLQQGGLYYNGAVPACEHCARAAQAWVAMAVRYADGVWERYSGGSDDRGPSTPGVSERDNLKNK